MDLSECAKFLIKELGEIWVNKTGISFKAGLTLNDLYDTTCMTHNWFSNFNRIYTIIQVAHTDFIKAGLTEYLAFKTLSEMI